MTDLSAALTAAESRHCIGLFLDAVDRHDRIGDWREFITSLQSLVRLVERIADGQTNITDDGRCRLSAEALQRIRSSNESSYTLAAQYGVAASTIRAVRGRMRA